MDGALGRASEVNWRQARVGGCVWFSVELGMELKRDSGRRQTDDGLGFRSWCSKKRGIIHHPPVMSEA